MSALAATATRIARLRRLSAHRRRVRRLLNTRAAYVPPAAYIPHSTADLWRVARPPYAR
jgi:hypothetical protein